MIYLKLELLKYRRRVMLWMYVGITAFVFINCFVNILLTGLEDNLSRSTIFDQFVITFCTSMILPIAIVVCYSVGSEFEYKVIQKSLVMGLTKRNYFCSKIAGYVALTVVFVIHFLLFASIYRYSFGYFEEVPIKRFLLAASNVATYGFICLLYCNLFAFKFRSTKKAILWFLVYIFSEHTIKTLFLTIYDINLWFLPFSAARSIFIDGERKINFLWETPIDFKIAGTLMILAFFSLVISYDNFRKKDLL